MCFASAEIIATLNKIKPPYNVNELTQQKAIARLEKQTDVEEEIKRIIAERDQMVLDLKSIDFIKTIYKTNANFVLVKVDDANLRYNQLIKKGIVIRNRTTQPLCDNCLRLTVGTSDENKKLMTVLKGL